MNRGSLQTRSFRRTHFFVFRYRWNKNDFTCQKSFRSFQETGPRTWCGQRLFNKSFQLLGGDGGAGGELSKMILERCCRSLELNQALTLFHNPFVDWIQSCFNETTDDLDPVWKHSAQLIQQWRAHGSYFAILVYVLLYCINTDSGG